MSRRVRDLNLIWKFYQNKMVDLFTIGDRHKSPMSILIPRFEVFVGRSEGLYGSIYLVFTDLLVTIWPHCFQLTDQILPHSMKLLLGSIHLFATSVKFFGCGLVLTSSPSLRDRDRRNPSDPDAGGLLGEELI